ncbi:MAG: indole-3-glycerol phosphate synthase TrpC [Pirellulales bacterium]|nr:indole-3-glycerol phosphate synthase TrpC [Pirellulales bacterium]
MPTILDRILATKRQEILAAQVARPEPELQAALADAPPARDFLAPLSIAGPIRLIAEVKKASPSAGLIRANFDPARIATTYANHGAACISVLTDEPFFQGRLQDLSIVRRQVDRPVLRKDFILDPYQLLEARVAGADAVLLIAECLDDTTLQSLVRKTLDLGMTPLVELYEPANLPRVIHSGAKLIGVNNRNLRTFEVDLNRTLRMREQVPGDFILVGESGIRTRADVERLEAAGVDAILVGESLMRDPDIGAAIDRLLGQ